MTILLVVDTETDGVKGKSCRCWEIAGVLYETDTKQVLRAWSSLIKVTERLPKSVEQLSRISSESLRHGVDMEEAIATLNRLEAMAEVTVAHNVAFDRPILERHGFRAKAWLDSVWDVPYPEGISRKLTYLAVEHGIPVLAANAHRALNDAMLVVQVLRHYNWQEQIRPYWMSRTVTLVARFPKKDIQARVVVKRFGFRWNGKQQQWEKPLRDYGGQVDSIRSQLKSIAGVTVR